MKYKLLTFILEEGNQKIIWHQLYSIRDLLILLNIIRETSLLWVGHYTYIKFHNIYY